MSDYRVSDEIEQAFRAGYLAGLKKSDPRDPQYFSENKEKVKIEGKLPSLNDYIAACRTNPHAGAKLKRETETLILLQIARMKPITSRVFIHFEWHEKNTRRDKDNVAAAKKFILDALQKAGKLPNDNNEFVAGFADTFSYGGEYGVVLTIERAAK